MDVTTLVVCICCWWILHVLYARTSWRFKNRWYYLKARLKCVVTSHEVAASYPLRCRKCDTLFDPAHYEETGELVKVHPKSLFFF